MSPFTLGRRGFKTQDPWMPVVVVIILAMIAFVTLRRFRNESRVRTGVMHSLAMLGDSQEAYRRRYGRFAERVDFISGPGVIGLQPDSGAQITITHADSLGWAATGTHPRIGRPSHCFIYGGGTAPHDPRLVHPLEPKCW